MTAPVRPTLPKLRQRIQADIEYHLPGANARAEESLLSTLAEANAGAFHGLYGYAEYLANQLLPDTADLEWLARWAIMLECPRLSATSAIGTLQGDTSTGALPLGTVFIDPLSLQAYETKTTGGDGTTTDIMALVAGQAGNLPTGTTLQLQRAVSGISSDATVLTLHSGADQETVESWRNRVARKLAERSRIGDRDDYSLWTESAHPAIHKAWVYPNEMGLGTIVIRCIGHAPDILPSNDVLAETQAALDQLRNAAATVFVLAASPRPVTIRISGVNDSSMQAGILRELELLFRVKQQQAALLRESEVDAAIQHYTVAYTLISPAQNIQCHDREVLVLEGVEWLA